MFAAKNLFLAGSAPKDPYFSYVSLLLPGNGTNGAQNNTFIDSSVNNIAVTRNGSTTQGTFTPYGSNWSNYFSGSGQYLSLGGQANFAFSTQDFTVEFWVFPINSNVQFYDGRPGINGNYLAIGMDASNIPGVYVNGANILISSTSLAANRWSHLAVTRSGFNLRMFINGIQTGLVTNTTDFLNGAGRPVLGTNGFNTTLSLFNGYFSNYRVVKGTAVYTSNFTPSTAPLTAISGTSLLTCQSNRFIDNSGNAFAITVTGSPSVQRFSPFNPTFSYSSGLNGGSMYSGGSGNYLTVADNAALQFGTSDLTIEGWIYPISAPGTINSIWAKRATTANYGGINIGYSNTGGVQLYIGDTSTTVWTIYTAANSPSTAFVFNAWNHFALVRSGTNWAFFVNGTRTNSFTSSGSVAPQAGVATSIGDGSAAGGQPINGYLSGIRSIKGAAIYNPTLTTLTVPTAPPTAITNTGLLLNMTNAGVIDNTMINDLETVGSAQISTAQSKFGGGSMSFPNSSYLQFLQNQNVQLGTGDFTIECWTYLVSKLNLYPAIWSNYNNYTTGGIALFAGHNSGTTTQYQVAINGAAFPTIQSTTAISYNSWVHLAVVRSSGVITLYVNGVANGTYSFSGALNGVGSLFSIGTSLDSTANGYINGYIDDFRITKGYARYTSNFTPPTQAFPTR